MNIYQRINEVRNQVEYLKRGSSGQGTGVLYDEVVALARASVIDQGIIITTDFISDNSRTVTNNSGKESYIYEAFIRVWYINSDDPNDKFSTDVVAHAMDSGDKAPGKAVTYATKTSLVKVLFLETGINDEKRHADQDSYSDEQFGMFHDFIANGDGLGLHMFTQCIPENSQISLYNSFEKGKITEGKKTANRLISDGAKQYCEMLDTIEHMAENEDPAIIENTDGLPDYAKRMVAKALSPLALGYLKKISDQENK